MPSSAVRSWTCRSVRAWACRRRAPSGSVASTARRRAWRKRLWLARPPRASTRCSTVAAFSAGSAAVLSATARTRPRSMSPASSAVRVAGSRSTTVTASSRPAAAAAGDNASSAAISSAAQPGPARFASPARVGRSAANRACARSITASSPAIRFRTAAIKDRQPSASQPSTAGRPPPAPSAASAGGPPPAPPRSTTDRPSAASPPLAAGGPIAGSAMVATESNIRTSLLDYPDISTTWRWPVRRASARTPFACTHSGFLRKVSN